GYDITFTYAINDKFCLKSHGWGGQWQFLKLVSPHRIGLGNGSYMDAEDPRRTMVCHYLDIEETVARFSWYDNIWPHGGHHMTVCKGYKAIQDQIDTYSRYDDPQKVTYTVPKVNFDEPF